MSAEAAVSTRPERTRPAWLVPAGLIFLSLIPVLAGAMRVTELTGDAVVTPKNERFFAAPVPVLVHIVGATVYSLLGAFQFVPALRLPRRGHTGWHRRAGVVLIPAGVAVALSGLWMTLFYQLPATDGFLLLILRLVFGTAMLASIVFGVAALLRRDFRRHGAWMARAYAIALGAGTQAFILIPFELLGSPPDVTFRAVLMGTAWVLNLAVAEYFIRRRSGHS